MNYLEMRDALEYVKSYIEECYHWDNTQPLLDDIAKFLDATPIAVELTAEEMKKAYSNGVDSAIRCGIESAAHYYGLCEVISEYNKAQTQGEIK